MTRAVRVEAPGRLAVVPADPPRPGPGGRADPRRLGWDLRIGRRPAQRTPSRSVRPLPDRARPVSRRPFGSFVETQRHTCGDLVEFAVNRALTGTVELIPVSWTVLCLGRTEGSAW